MKKEQLRKYIREEIDNMVNQKEPKNKTVSNPINLGGKLMQLSKDLKSGVYKDLDSSEIKSLDILLTKIINAAEAGNAASLLQRIEKMI